MSLSTSFTALLRRQGFLWREVSWEEAETCVGGYVLICRNIRLNWLMSKREHFLMFSGGSSIRRTGLVVWGGRHNGSFWVLHSHVSGWHFLCQVSLMLTGNRITVSKEPFTIRPKSFTKDGEDLSQSIDQQWAPVGILTSCFKDPTKCTKSYKYWVQICYYSYSVCSAHMWGSAFAMRLFCRRAALLRFYHNVQYGG